MHYPADIRCIAIASRNKDRRLLLFRIEALISGYKLFNAALNECVDRSANFTEDSCLIPFYGLRKAEEGT